MANEGLKPVGIQLIVENVGPAVAGMTQAAQAEKVLVETVKEVGTTITQVEGGLKSNIQSMLEQGATVKQVSQFYCLREYRRGRGSSYWRGGTIACPDVYASITGDSGTK